MRYLYSELPRPQAGGSWASIVDARSRHEPAGGESSRETLVRRMAAGDHAAMAEFYDQTSALVFGLALRIVGDHGAAEDIAVEVYAQVVEAGGRLRSVARQRRWPGC